MAVTGAALGTSLAINAGVCIVALAIFTYMRYYSLTRKFYMPRRFDPEVKKKPRRLPVGLFSWIRPVLLYPEEEITTVAGLDVVIFLRLLKYGWVLFLFCTLYGLIIIMPVNATAGYLSDPTTNTTGTSDLDKLSVSNIAPGNSRFWLHLISTYIITLVALALLWGFSMDVSKLRAKFITTLPRGGSNHTVLFTDVPGIKKGTMLGRSTTATAVTGKVPIVTKVMSTLKTAKEVVQSTVQDKTSTDLRREELEGSALPASTMEEVLEPWDVAQRLLQTGSYKDMVEREVKDVYGASHVAAVNVAYDVTKMDKLLAQYEKAKGQLTDITDDYVGRIRHKQEKIKRRTISVNMALAPAWAKEKYGAGASMGCCGKSAKVDALEYLPAQMEHLKAEMKAGLAGVTNDYLPAAFVTMNDRYTTTAAVTGLHSYDEQLWRAQGAPGAEEVVWSNLGLRHWNKTGRNVIVWVIFILIIIFYLPVTAAIQAVVNLDNVNKVPGLEVITRIPFVTQVLQGILPQIVLIVFLIILPPVLNMLHQWQGMVSISQIDFATVNKYFIFQLFATFIYTFITGSAIGQIQAIINNGVGELVSLLGVAAPQQASFYMSFIAIKACGMGLMMLRIVPLIVYLLFNRIAGTEKAKYRLWAKQDMRFSTYTTDASIILLLGLAFTVLAPLIAPFTLMYFTLALLAHKYNLLYVASHPYEAAGRMWKTIFGQIMTGIYAMQVIVIVVLAVKRFPYIVLILPLPIGTAIFSTVVMSLFARPWDVISLKEAAVLDRAEGGVAHNYEEAQEMHQMYLAPIFKLDEEEHEELVSLACQVDAKLNGEDVELHIKDMDSVPETDDAPAYVDEIVAKKTSGALGEPGTMGAGGDVAYTKDVVLADKAEQGLVNRGDRRSASPE